jgi:hypothetical protein
VAAILLTKKSVRPKQHSMWSHSNPRGHGRIQGVQGVRIPLPAESARFLAESALFVEECNFQCSLEIPKTHSFIAQNQNFPQKTRHSFIAQNQKNYTEKIFFLQLGKTWKRATGIGTRYKEQGTSVLRLIRRTRAIEVQQLAQGFKQTWQ